MDDLDAVLEDWDEVLDVAREDLDALFRSVEARVNARR
jgi:CBS domain-containing membrane protein